MELTNYTLILTDNCNLRCTYCFDNLYSDRSCIESKSMNIDMIPDLFLFIEKTRSKTKPITFNMFGGEPTLNWNFFKQFIEMGVENFKFEYRFVTTTNGTLLTSEKIDFLKKHNVGVSVSLDGTQTANKERITIDNKPTWDKVMQVLPELKAKVPGTSVLVTIGKYNYEHIYDSYRMLLELGFNPTLNFNHYDDYTQEELKSIEEQLTHLFIQDNLRLPHSMARKLEDGWACDGTVCAPADKIITIAPNGKLYFCHQFVPKMTDTDDMSYGTIKEGIKDYTLYDTFVKRSYFFSYDKDNNMKCNSCSVKSTCKGGCMAEQWHKTKSFIEVNPNICSLSEIIDRVLRR